MTEGKLNSVFIFLEFFPILSDYKSTMEMLSFYADLGPWVCVSVNHEGIFLFVIRLYSSNCVVHIFVQYSYVCDSILTNDTHLVFCFLNFYRWVEFKHWFLIYCETELITIVFVGHVHMLLLYKCDITILYLFAFTHYIMICFSLSF